MTTSRTVFWRIKERKGYAYVVEFWKKPDKSDAITKLMLRTDEGTMRAMIEEVAGLKRFSLEFVRD